jgi:hypothetical protein
VPSSEVSQPAVSPTALPQPDILLWSYTAFQRISADWYRPDGWPIPLCRWRLAMRFSQSAKPRDGLVSQRHSLVGLRSPLKYFPSITSWFPQVPAPLLRSVPLQHIKDRRSACRGLCLPATFRPQGLTTLSAAYSLRARARHISGRRRSWGSPFGAFLSHKVARPLGPTLPTRRYTDPATRSKPRDPASALGLWVSPL